MITPEARARLAEQMEERRLELRLTWREVSEAGGISYEVVRNLRNGRGTGIAALTKRGIDRGLQWLEGRGVDNILAGRAPLPAVMENRPADAEQFAREVGLNPASPDDAVIADLRRAIDKAEEVYGENATGAQVFRGKPWSATEAALWDDPGISREGKILLVAATRALRDHDEAARQNSSGRAGLTLAILARR